MIIIVPCYIIILCIICMFPINVHALFDSSEPSAVAHAEAAVLQRAPSVESTPRRSTAADVGWQPSQGRRQTRTTSMLPMVKLSTTTVDLLQLYKTIIFTFNKTISQCSP